MGFPGGTNGKEPACRCRRPRFGPWVGKVPWRREWQPTPVFLPGESPWTEEPSGLRSMGLERIGHDWAHTHTHTHPHGEKMWNIGFYFQDLKKQLHPAPTPCLQSQERPEQEVASEWSQGSHAKPTTARSVAGLSISFPGGSFCPFSEVSTLLLWKLLS